MPTKRNRKAVVSDSTELAARVDQLEADMRDARSRLRDLGDDLSMLRSTIRHIDDRTLRGERVMLSIQVEALKVSKKLDMVIQGLKLELPKFEAAEDILKGL